MYEPQQGDILIDGRSIRCITQQSLWQRIALVLQQDVLLSRTVEENIAFGRPGITRTRIEETLQWLGLQPFIERLPQGLDTRLGERGVNLSAGERQLIALCRAVVGNADVIVLDEATAHVDSLTEELIGKALERIRGHRTLLVIAHRLATVQGADRIVVLHRGEVRELGTHEELLAAGGIYARLYRLQAMAQGVAG
jgi:ATP-binding cassette subfamily B protein